MESEEIVVPPELQILGFIIIIFVLLIALGLLYLKYNKLKNAQKTKYNESFGKERTSVPTPAVTLASYEKPQVAVATEIPNLSVDAIRGQNGLDLKKQLRILLTLYTMELEQNGVDPDSDWRMYEHNRWVELVAHLLNQIRSDKNALTSTTNAVLELHNLNLLEIDTLAMLGNPQDKNATVITFVLMRHGFSENNAKRAVDILAHISKIIKEKYNGKIQRGIRDRGDKVRVEFVNEFASKHMGSEELMYPVSYWLQSVLNLPISSNDKEIEDFCRKSNASLNDFNRISDELDLNLIYAERISKTQLYREILDRILLEMEKIPKTNNEDDKDWEIRAMKAINSVLTASPSIIG
jgi:hypothetical protein